MRLARTCIALVFPVLALQGQQASVQGVAGSATVTTPPPISPPPEVAALAGAPVLQGISGGGDVEFGQRVVLTVLFSGSGDGQAYQWSKGDAPIPGATAASYTIPEAAPADTATYTVSVANAAGASVASTVVNVKAAAALVITRQPQAAIVAVGQGVTFYFQATGSFPRTYQWRRNGAAIPGATESAYTINPVGLADAGTYSVDIANSFGSVSTAAASLTVNAAQLAVISSSSPYDATTTEGSSASFSVYLTSGSAPFTYQWLKDGVALPGTNTQRLELNPVTRADAGSYSVTVTNAAGTATSRQATLTVNPPTPISFYQSPQNTSVYEGESASFYVGANGSGPITYQWLKNGNPIAGANSGSYSIQKTQLSDAGSYSAKVTNPAGSATTLPAVLTVNPPVLPSFTRQPLGQTVPYGESFSLSVDVSGSPPLSYVWKKDGIAVGATDRSYYVSNAKAEHGGVYTVVVTNPAGSVTSQSATVVVQPAVVPFITQQPRSQTLAYGKSFELSVQASGSPTMTYQWKKDGVALGSSSSSYYVSNATPSNSGVYTVVITNPAGSVTSTSATVTVNPAIAPTISRQPASQSVAYGASISLSVQASGSPTLQYRWMKDGVALGATGSSYYINNATPDHNGRYTVVITNPAGSVTSEPAVISVSAAVAPAITQQPQGRTADYGSSFSLSVQASGSPPLTYVWKKDGTTLQDTDSSLSFYNSTPADSGVYTVTVSNSVGSVTSQQATVLVQAALAPQITRQPQSQTVNYNDSISLSVSATGSPDLRYQWRKDGVSLGANATSSYFYLYNATPANSGIYTVVITNPAGSVVSSSATITVQAAKAPVITRQPVSAEVALGLSASFSPVVETAGAGPLTYQWRRNGNAIAGATSSYYNIESVTDANAGDYTLVVTGAGGTVTSEAARLTVLAAAAPRITSSTQYATARMGDRLWLSIDAQGSPPLTYQWYRNGVQLSGGTNSSMELVNLGVDDLGTYTATVSGPGGVATSPPIEVRLSASAYASATPWIDAAQLGDVVYFLASVPSRIERFDLMTERWLPTVLLSETLVPTAFVPTAEGVYVAYGRALARRTSDLSSEVAITNSAEPITHLFAFGDFVYYNGSGSSSPSTYRSVNRTTLQSGPTIVLGNWQREVRQLSFASSLRRGFGWSYQYGPYALVMFTLASDGSLAGAPVDGSQGNAMPTANRTFVLPGEQWLADEAGSVYSTSDLSFVGAFSDGFHDLAFLSDGTSVILRQQTLSLAPRGQFVETARVTLPQAGLRLFTRGSTAYVFGNPTIAGGSYSVTKVASSAFTPSGSTSTTNPPVGRYSVDDAFLAPDHVVHVLSRTLQGLMRWSADTRALLPTVNLRNVPAVAFQQPGGSRVLFGYNDGVVTELPFASTPPAERPIGTTNLRLRAVTDLDNMVLLNAYESRSTADTRIILSSSGNRLQAGTASQYGNPLAWLGAGRRLYSSASYNTNSMRYEIVPESGQLPTSAAGPATSIALSAPLRFNAEGTLAATGNGRVVNADLAQVGLLANEISDAVWLPDGLYTLRAFHGASEVQQWTRGTYLLTRSTALRGTPVRLFRLSDAQLVAVTNAQGMAAFTVLNADLTISTSAAQQILVSSQPRSQALAPSGAATLAVAQVGASGSVSYQWRRDGAAIPGATNASYTAANVQSAQVGLYAASISDGTHTTSSDPAIVGLVTTSKLIGLGELRGADITHPNGNKYDQVLLTGAAGGVTADAGKVTRTSFIDLNGDIVQVEFAGAGTLSIVLAGASGPAAPVNYSQPSVSYMQGHAAIVITGANETTNVSVFSVGRLNAYDPTGRFNFLQPLSVTNDPAANGNPLFEGHALTNYDGVADIAYIAILSDNGKFGGVRAANANFFASGGVTGVYAPGVEFTGPVLIGDINAYDTAQPMIITGAATDVRITGGDLAQPNSKPVKISGLTRVRFVDGVTSHGTTLNARMNQARFDQNGVDVTDAIVANPGS